MKRASNLFSSITTEDVKRAARRAFVGHESESAVLSFERNFESRCQMMYERLMDGSYVELLRYRKLDKRNWNGKMRHINSPSLMTRIYQVLFLERIEPLYYSKDNLNGVNCKKGYGIHSKQKNKSALHRLKHLYYDCLDLKYVLIIDQRKCYDHVTVKHFRSVMKQLTDDKQFIDFAIAVCFVNGKLPIGTPSSPMVHHLMMLPFDHFVKSLSRHSVRYADDNLLAFHTKEEAQAAKWRVKNWWWYVCGIRAKRQRTLVLPMDLPCDFCGYVFHRNHRAKTMHDKGYVTVRASTVRRAKRCKSDDSWASYFGLMKHADSYKLMTQIEEQMKFNKLTEKIRITRKMDATHIDVSEVTGKPFNLYEYEIRRDRKNEPNWIKCLIGMPEKVNEKETGRELAFEFHGSYQYLIEYLMACEAHYGENFKRCLPLEEVEIENMNGLIFKGSTNQIKYIAS